MADNKLSFNQLTQLVNEDQVAQSDKWATGMSGRSMGPRQYTLVDLLKKNDDQHPNNTTAPKNMPHNTQMMIELMGDLLLHADNIQHAFELALENPVLEGKPKASEQLKSMSRKVSKIKSIMKEIADDVDNFSIESSNK
tara:strand:+ start:318 stop:734 length:417 start_codon:yes stop_codon:yes gene_type:complete